jgi:hypothetical protein
MTSHDSFRSIAIAEVSASTQSKVPAIAAARSYVMIVSWFLARHDAQPTAVSSACRRDEGWDVDDRAHVRSFWPHQMVAIVGPGSSPIEEHVPRASRVIAMLGAQAVVAARGVTS